jgi:hypothetical protein
MSLNERTIPHFFFKREEILNEINDCYEHKVTEHIDLGIVIAYQLMQLN